MLNAMSRKGPLAVTVALLLAAGAALILFVAAQPPTAVADQNANNNTCRGSTSKGAPDPNDDTVTGVAFNLRCSGPITGFSVMSAKPIQGYETEVFAFDPAGQNIIGTDAFSCSGDIPGFGVNCVGTYGGGYRQIRGEFFIDGKNALCKRHRVEPIVTVTTASINSKGAPVSAIAGPFSLGTPRGCKGKVHRSIPSEGIGGGDILVGSGQQ